MVRKLSTVDAMAMQIAVRQAAMNQKKKTRAESSDENESSSHSDD